MKNNDKKVVKNGFCLTVENHVENQNFSRNFYQKYKFWPKLKTHKSKLKRCCCL